jgi:hypothetical protein
MSRVNTLFETNSGIYSEEGVPRDGKEAGGGGVIFTYWEMETSVFIKL